ncbi:MAG: hypothetical protein IPJ31_13470 [Bacteroidetes bacterium]|nr:hypothetical protein [Bacteroidota bacterium]
MSAGLERMRINSTTGNVAIGTATGAAKLHVLSTSTVDTAIFASANDASASNQIGVLGTYNTSGFGAGIVGRGFGGSVPPVGAQDIGVYGSSSGIAVWSNGPLRVTDGTQGTGKILTSDASGNATWQQKIFSSAYTTANATPVADTVIDGTTYKRLIVDAPQLTAADLSSAAIDVSFIIPGGTSPFILPYTSAAGGSANTMMALPAVGKIFILRWTHATPGTASIGISGTLQYRYVITRP